MVYSSNTECCDYGHLHRHPMSDLLSIQEFLSSCITIGPRVLERNDGYSYAKLSLRGLLELGNMLHSFYPLGEMIIHYPSNYHIRLTDYAML